MPRDWAWPLHWAQAARSERETARSSCFASLAWRRLPSSGSPSTCEACATRSRSAAWLVRLITRDRGRRGFSPAHERHLRACASNSIDRSSYEPFLRSKTVRSHGGASSRSSEPSSPLSLKRAIHGNPGVRRVAHVLLPPRCAHGRGPHVRPEAWVRPLARCLSFSFGCARQNSFCFTQNTRGYIRSAHTLPLQRRP